MRAELSIPRNSTQGERASVIDPVNIAWKYWELAANTFRWAGTFTEPACKTTSQNKPWLQDNKKGMN